MGVHKYCTKGLDSGQHDLSGTVGYFLTGD
jgi:hypothetical protein